MSNFFDLFLDPRTYGERRVERDLQQGIASLASAQASETGALRREAAEMRLEVFQLEKQVMRLTAMVSVLAQALGKAGAYDEAWAREELTTLLQKIDPPPAPAPPPPARAATPYRDAHAAHPAQHAAAPLPKLVECTRCHQQVDAAHTVFSEQGVVCDACQRAIDLGTP